MSNRLVHDPDGVAALAAQVADTTGLPAAQIEKDFWVTEVLRGVTEAAKTIGVEVVFELSNPEFSERCSGHGP